MPPTRRLVVAHCAVFGVCKLAFMVPLGGTVIFVGAIFYVYVDDRYLRVRTCIVQSILLLQRDSDDKDTDEIAHATLVNKDTKCGGGKGG
jgi:hypothetical protein